MEGETTLFLGCPRFYVESYKILI